MQARSTVTDCEFGAADSASFSIQNADDPAIVIGPLGIDGSGQVVFDDVPAGNWTVIQNTANASSQAFAVSDQITTSISVITYVPAFVDLFVEIIYCQDDARAGTTEFTLDTPPDFAGLLAVTSSCFAESPFLERPPLTITLDNLDTDESFRDTIDVGGTWFDEIPSGMYTVTESIDGQEPITSEPFELVETGKRVRIINYEPEEERPAPDFEGAGNLNGLLLFCSASGRDGDVDFIVESEARFATAAVATCDVGSFISGQLVLYPVDRYTGVVDVDAGETLYTGPFGDFSAYEILSGYYALGYQSPATGDLTVSEPFAMYGGGWASIEVNVFSAPVATGDIEIYKDFCVDPERAGEVGFQINEPPEEPGFPELLATASTECRYSNDSDGAFDLTLINIDTGRTWTQTLVGSDFITFTGFPIGTYTLTESRDGSETTSSHFAYEAGFGYYSIYVRNFIAERDWQPDPGDNEFEYVSVYGYICVDLSRDGGAEYVHYGPAGQQGPEGEPGQPTAMLAATTSTAECHAGTEADGLSFTAIPADPVADPIPSFTDGTGYYSPATESLPSGDYVISEAVTGVSTGTLRLSGVHNIDFLQYEPLPTASVTVDVASADPAIANALPADATWLVSQNGTELFGDTFAAGHLQLPASIAVTNPVIYGTYEVTVNAGPTFEPYTRSFTVDEAVEVFAIVLQPISREPTAPVETNDVVVTVTTVDGGDIPTGTEICLTGSAYADCWALDAVAGSMIAAAAPSGTTVAFSDVPLGTYELTIPANDPYLAHAETIRVPEENPYQVLVVLLLQDVTPSPTVTPGTVTPTATANPGTATATATQAAVTGLPSTGNGAGDESSRVSTALLIGGSALAFSLALGLAWHQRRTQGANV